MKKSFFSLLSCTIALTVLLTGCNNEKTADSKKITDFPLTSSSTDAKASFEQGLALNDQGDFQASRAFFVKAVDQDPSFALAHLYKANTALSPKEFADELNEAKAHLDSVSEWEKLYYDYTSTFLDNNWNKRLEVTQKIATAYPDAARAQVDLGYTYLSGNQDAKARECFLKATQMDSNWVGGYSALSGSYVFSDPKDFAKAEEASLKMVALAPKSAGAEILLGDCYRAQNNMEKARDAYAKAIELDPGNSNSYYKKGNANTFLGKFDDARNDYTEGARHDIGIFGEVTAVANTYLYAGDPKMALDYLHKKYMELDSSKAAISQINNTKYAIIDACANIDKHTGDAASLKKLIPTMETVYIDVAGDIGTQEAKSVEKANILYWQSEAAAMEGNYDVAKAKAEECRTTLDAITDPNKLNNYNLALGDIDMKQKNYTDAIGHFEKTNPVFIYNKYCQAMANEAAGNKDKANTLYKEIAGYNFTDVGYALIRAEVKKKVGNP